MICLTKVKYTARILADAEFVEWLIAHDKTYFFKLTHIKASSIECKKEHNIMLEEDVQKILSTGKIKETNLRAAFKGIPVPKEISSKLTNKVDQLVVFAIVLATKTPFKSYIFTTKNKIEQYKSSLHFANIKSVSIKEEIDAVGVIDSFWNDFRNQRDSFR